MSLITVMAGAAVSPALGSIKQHFSTVDPVLIKMILTVPGLLILVMNLCFSSISSKLSTKVIALIGLAFYIIGGTSGAFATTIYSLLFSRALLGIGVGLIMPLSTGLLAYYFEADEQKKLMGYSVAMNNLGGIIAMSLSGLLAAIQWNYSFFVYLTGVIVFILVLFFLPKDFISRSKDKIEGLILRDKYIYILIMFLLNVTFYMYIVNFSIIATSEGIATPENIGVLMSAQSIGALVMAAFFGKISKKYGRNINKLGIYLFMCSFLMLTMFSHYLIYAFALIFCGMGFGTLMSWVNSKAVEGIEKSNAPRIMSLMSIGMYSGQFLSPLITSVIGKGFGVTMLRFPYVLAVVVSCVILIVISFEGRTQKRICSEV